MSTIASGLGASAGPTQIQSDSKSLNAEDFIAMMVTQLQNQDPLEPQKNSELLGQMSQIGQLQSQTDLQESLETMVLQQSIGSAGQLIGKTVTGLGDTGEVTGVVNSVRVEDGSVVLELDTGEKLAMENVVEINETRLDTIEPELGFTSGRDDRIRPAGG
ncbi:MAG: flagellar hook capping FlgD N-terminal domain-containing protein [Planctomycetota bacterium]